MPRIVMLAGAMGTGKSWLLENCCINAVQVDVEALQYKAVIKHLGSEVEDPYGWQIWNEDMQQSAKSLLGDVFDQKYSEFPNIDTRPIVLAGSLLVAKWNREAWLSILAERFPNHNLTTGLLLDLPFHVIAKQIKQRGRTNEQMIDEEQLRRHLNGYRGHADQFWEIMNSSKQAADRLGELLK